MNYPAAWPALILGLATFRAVLPFRYGARMDGICECGCGLPTRLAPVNDASKGWIKGRPLRFRLGHNARVTNRPRRVLSEKDWKVEDRGYATPCWIWKGKSKAGHGRCDHRRVGIDGGYEPAHAAVYRRFVGPIEEGHELHHLCEVQACVCPDHLTPITKAAHLSLRRKLSGEDVAAIRCDERILREVAADYGVSTTTVSDIRRGKVRYAAT